MNFVLPKQAHVHRHVPKNKFFEKAVVNSKLKQEFVDVIQKITWEYKLAEETIGIPGTETVEEIQVFDIQLKQKEIPKNVLKIIDKTIPYPILYVFRFEQHVAYGITLKDDASHRYYFSAWDEEKHFSFVGMTLERVYQGIVKSFIDISEKVADFTVAVAVDKQREALAKEISILQNKVRNEKQFNRKAEINRTLLSKKRKLELLLKSISS